MKVLVLGASGMIGNAMFRALSRRTDWTVVGTVRSEGDKAWFPEPLAARMIAGIDLAVPDTLARLFCETRPQVVVNCVGLTKHLPDGNRPLTAITMNTLLPHRLAELCCIVGARLIHVSTDCVFSGARGSYQETDQADSPEIYGRSKALGEPAGPGVVTLRTSTVGHELHTKHGLLEWFLSQAKCKGFARAVFSGLPSVIFAEIVRDRVIPDATLTGLYHVGAQPIAKADLLRMIADVYEMTVEIVQDDSLVIDRSLDSSRFSKATGYIAPPWPEMIVTMRDQYEKDFNRHV